jgi:hypothetical protein
MCQGEREERVAEGQDLAPDTRQFEWLGLALAMVSFTVLVYGFTLAGTDGWGTPIVIGSLIGGGVLLVAFVVVELSVTDPVLDLRLFRSSTFTIANALIWTSSTVFFTGLFLVPSVRLPPSSLAVSRRWKRPVPRSHALRRGRRARQWW